MLNGRNLKHEKLIAESKNALDQIKEKKYAQEFHAQGITNILAYGIAFSGKQLLVSLEKM